MSHTGRNPRILTSLANLLAMVPVVGILTCLLLAGPAAAQDIQDGSAQILSELEEIIERGERNNSADPDFLAALRDLVRRNTWPWQRVLLSDTFSDGNFTSNPRWTNTSGDVSVDRNRGLVMRADNRNNDRPPIFIPPSQLPPGGTGDILSSAGKWNGATDRFAFQSSGGIRNVSSGNTGGTITIFGGSNGGGVRSNDSFVGDFSFQYNASNNNQVRIGLYATSQDAQFRPFEGRRENETSGLTAMSKAWWIRDGKQIMQGPAEVGLIDIAPQDRVEFRREGETILITVNGQIAHIYERESAEPLRSIINYVSSRNFFVDGVGWSLGSTPQPDSGDDLIVSSPDAWFGAVGDFVYRRGGIVSDMARSAIATQDVFSGDLVFIATVGRGNSGRTMRVGLYGADEDFRFDPNSGLGGLQRMSNSWYFADGQLVSGNQVVATNVRLRAGSEIEFRRVGRRISVFVDGQQVHTFRDRSSAPLRGVIAHSSRPGSLDLRQVAWASDNLSGDGGGFEPPISEDARLEAQIFVTNAFAIEMTLISQNRRGGKFEIGLERRRDQVGYRLVLSLGRPQTLELIRSDRRGDVTIGSTNRNGNLNDGRPHDILVTRGVDGLMSVSIDDVEWIGVIDQAIRVPFNLLSLTDRRGEFVITSVTAYGL